MDCSRWRTNIHYINDNLSIGIYVFDKDQRFVYANHRWLREMRMTLDEVLGKTIEEVFTAWFCYPTQYFEISTVNGVLTLSDKPLNGFVALEVLRGKRPRLFVSGNHYPTELIIQGTPIFVDGVVEQVVMMVQDLTELSEMSRELQEQYQKQIMAENELSYFRQHLFNKDFVGECPEIKEILDIIHEISSSDVPVLITGETGVGKELIAESVVQTSRRRDKPFIRVNCATIPAHLAEAELFGYAPGAFTGASKSGKAGYFETANGGTIFLDEIGELPVELQTKLLRVLQQQTIIRLGATEAIHLDVRVIAATNQNLKLQIERRLFRQDLYFRLNVIELKVPPLRKRGKDIALLANTFLAKFNKKYGKQKRLTAPAIRVLERYDWPGNIRELKNLMERIVLLGNEQEISAQRLSYYLEPGEVQEFIGDENLSLKETVRQYEKRILLQVIRDKKSTRKAAAALQVSQATLARKLQEYGIQYTTAYQTEKEDL